jgi:hypothetical protein
MKTAFILSAAIIIPIWLAIFMSGVIHNDVNDVQDFSSAEIKQSNTTKQYFKICASTAEGRMYPQTCDV